MRRLSTFAAPAEEFKRCIAIDPAAQWGCTIGSFARADRLALLLFLHVEAEEFERLVVVDPAAPRMRVEQKDIIGLVGDFARKTRGALETPRLSPGVAHRAQNTLG
jgi:hypothetical protein